MLHKAWNSKRKMPYCFPRSSIKFQGHTVQNITDFYPNWTFPDYKPVAAFKSLRFALFPLVDCLRMYVSWGDWIQMVYFVAVGKWISSFIYHLIYLYVIYIIYFFLIFQVSLISCRSRSSVNEVIGVHLICWKELTQWGRERQNGRHFPDDILKWIFFNENVWISIEISLKFVPKGQINNIPALVQIMAWCRPGDKPLSEPMMVSLLTHICITQPQWVNCWSF